MEDAVEPWHTFGRHHKGTRSLHREPVPFVRGMTTMLNFLLHVVLPTHVVTSKQLACEWAQNGTTLFVSVLRQQGSSLCSGESVAVPTGAMLVVSMNCITEARINLALRHNVLPETIIIKNERKSVFISLRKAELQRWDRLVMSPSEYSGLITVDWRRWSEEWNEEEEAQAEPTRGIELAATPMQEAQRAANAEAMQERAREEAVLHTAGEQLKHGELTADSLALFRRSARMQPADFRAQAMLGQALAAHGDLGALDALRNAHALAPTVHGVSQTLAGVLRRRPYDRHHIPHSALTTWYPTLSD